MSKTLRWRPVTIPRGNLLPDEIKYAIASTIFGHDGTLTGQVTLNADHLSYLQGLCDAKVIGAATLRDAIRKHAAVELWLE